MTILDLGALALAASACGGARPSPAVGPTEAAAPAGLMPAILAEDPLEEVCERAVAGLAALHREADSLRDGSSSPEDAVEAFDPMRYLGVLDRLEVRDGLVLDALGVYEEGGGRPVLYTRPVGEPPFATLEAFEAARGPVREQERRFTLGLATDGTPAGFLELALLEVLGGQYLLDWHWGYFDTEVLCGRAAVEAVIAPLSGGSGGSPPLDEMEETPVEPEAIAAARAHAPEPVVELRDELAVVRLTTFSRWGGFVERTSIFARSVPHELVEQREVTVAEYDCGESF